MRKTVKKLLALATVVCILLMLVPVMPVVVTAEFPEAIPEAQRTVTVSTPEELATEMGRRETYGGHQESLAENPNNPTIIVVANDLVIAASIAPVADSNKILVSDGERRTITRSSANHFLLFPAGIIETKLQIGTESCTEDKKLIFDFTTFGGNFIEPTANNINLNVQAAEIINLKTTPGNFLIWQHPRVNNVFTYGEGVKIRANYTSNANRLFSFSNSAPDDGQRRVEINLAADIYSEHGSLFGGNVQNTVINFTGGTYEFRNSNVSAIIEQIGANTTVNVSGGEFRNSRSSGGGGLFRLDGTNAILNITPNTSGGESPSFRNIHNNLPSGTFANIGIINAISGTVNISGGTFNGELTAIGAAQPPTNGNRALNLNGVNATATITGGTFRDFGNTTTVANNINNINAAILIATNVGGGTLNLFGGNFINNRVVVGTHASSFINMGGSVNMCENSPVQLSTGRTIGISSANPFITTREAIARIEIPNLNAGQSGTPYTSSVVVLTSNDSEYLATHAHRFQAGTGSVEPNLPTNNLQGRVNTSAPQPSWLPNSWGPGSDDLSLTYDNLTGRFVVANNIKAVTLIIAGYNGTTTKTLVGVPAVITVPVGGDSFAIPGGITAASVVKAMLWKNGTAVPLAGAVTRE